MVIEDFTTYTEVDVAEDRIQRTVSHVDHKAYMNEDTYLYKDRGADHFGDFTHFVDVKSDFFEIGGFGIVWGLLNLVDDIYGNMGVGKPAQVHLEFVCCPPPPFGVKELRLTENVNNGGSQDISIPLSANTWYYLKIVKSGTSLKCYIYGDSDRTVLVDTLSVVLQADHKFRYIFVCNTYNNGLTWYLNNDIANLDLGELPPPKKLILKLDPAVGIALGDISKRDRVIVL